MRKIKLRRKRKLTHIPNGRVLGREHGYHSGWLHGRYYGRCQSIMRSYYPGTFPRYNVRILYVTSGMGIPYSPLDKAILNSLYDLAAEVSHISPKADVVSRAHEFRPDLLLVLNGMQFSVDKVEEIKSIGIRTAIWFTDDPYYTDVTAGLASHYDDVFTLELNCVPFYQSRGCANVHYLPFGVDLTAFYPKPVDQAHRYDICFIGSAYWYRVAFFEQLVPFLATQNVYISGWWWNRLPNYHRIADKVKSGAWHSPEETASHYMGAKIVINLHRSHDDDSYNRNSLKIPGFSVNPRTFEISGSGGFQLTDVRQDLFNVYQPGYEIATYTSPHDLIEKIQYYLHHEEERQEIALRGLKRTVTEHTYHHRVSSLLSTLFHA